jgi:hypothetical protein
MRTAKRRSRAAHFRALWRELRQVQSKIGDPHYRTAKDLQKRAETRCRHSSVGKLVQVWTTETDGQVQLHWRVDRQALQDKMLTDGRYLLVTNDPSLSPARMLALYRQKDGVEKCFLIGKQYLKITPIYLHKDERIQGMLLVNMLALLTYSLLERQVRQAGLSMTLRSLIARLEDLSLIETHCWDGSVSRRLTPLDEEQRLLLLVLADILKSLRWPHMRLALPGNEQYWPLLEPPSEDLLMLPLLSSP